MSIGGFGFGYDWSGSSLLASVALRQAEGQLARAEARLVGIRSFLADVEPSARAVFPSEVLGWRSPASTRFVERLQSVRWLVEMMLAAVIEAERSASFDVSTGQQHCEELGRQLAQAEEAEEERRIEQAVELAERGRGSWAERER